MAELHERVTAELENIDTVVTEIEELIADERTDKYAVNSFALYLHNFYNGVENILKQLIRSRDLMLPSGDTWHKDLLGIARGNAIISETLYAALLDYLNFRHFVVHSYSFTLELDLFFPLIINLPDVYRDFKSQIVSSL
jgi:uncharacterized protein YutE (UPF0331/DUF86 family)